MKKLLFVFLLSLSAHSLWAQTAEISKDDEGNKVVRGFLTQASLATDSSFAWFAQNKSGYTPNKSALDVLKKDKDSLNFLVFGGTWCHDTQFILPKFFTLAEAAGVTQDKITLLGVDHNKKTIEHLSETFNVTLVPTIIVLKNGKEIGRVVEYGKYGMFDKELGEIVANSGK